MPAPCPQSPAPTASSSGSCSMRRPFWGHRHCLGLAADKIMLGCKRNFLKICFDRYSGAGVLLPCFQHSDLLLVLHSLHFAGVSASVCISVWMNTVLKVFNFFALCAGISNPAALWLLPWSGHLGHQHVGRKSKPENWSELLFCFSVQLQRHMPVQNQGKCGNMGE